MSLKVGDKVTQTSQSKEGKVIALHKGSAWVDFGAGPYTTDASYLTKVPDKFEIGKTYEVIGGTGSRRVCVHIQDGIAFFKAYAHPGSNSYEGAWAWTKNRPSYREI